MSSVRTESIVFSVSELNQTTRELLEHSFGLLWVEGEISNLARPRSGHVYFSLKDGKAQIRCALFRNKARLIRTTLADGEQIRVRARVSLYTTRGDYQLIIEHAEPAGQGALRQAFEKLRQRLDEEGLFNPDHKRSLPAGPERVAVITSATGAAIRDVVSVMRRRLPLGALRIYPVPVQGESAAAAVTRAVTLAGKRRDCDAILLVRGGGSLEDLWAFNDESLARAIVACPVPIVSGVGHEVDVTIADLAADMRAATPSAAAELICPDMTERERHLQRQAGRLEQLIRVHRSNADHQLRNLTRRLTRQKPDRRLEAAAQRLDDAEIRLQRAMARCQSAHDQQLKMLAGRLRQASPRRRLVNEGNHIHYLTRRSRHAIQRHLDSARFRFETCARTLYSVSPLQTLERGYAIARDEQSHILRQATTVKVGQNISVKLSRGELTCQVQAVHDPATSSSREN